MVYRIRPQGLQILTPTYLQHFQEVHNTAWVITVLNIEPKCMIEGWVKRKVIAQLLPFEKDFEPLTWRPTYYNGEIPPVKILAMYLGGRTTTYSSVIMIGTSTSRITTTSLTLWFNMPHRQPRRRYTWRCLCLCHQSRLM